MMARNMATNAPELWSGNQISIFFSSRIPIQLDEDGCLKEPQSFYLTPHKLAQIWEHGVHTWAQMLGRTLHGRPYFLDER